MQRVHFRFLVTATVLASAVAVNQVSAQQPPSVTGDQKTLVIVADFTDQATSCTVESIHTAMFDPVSSVDALYRDNSSGKVSFSGDVVGPYTVNRASTDPCSLSALSMAAEASAAAAGVNLSAYPRRVYVMPPNSCGAGGHGTVGGATSQAWVFACHLPGVFAHNLGHNLGMSHASSAAPLPNEEYGDPSDVMAFGTNRLPGLNAPHRDQFGWLSATSLLEVAEDSDLSIAPLGVDPAIALAPQVIRIRKPDTNEYYYLSYRTQVGFDRFIDARFFDRISVHRYKGDGSSTNTYLVANLGDGESYTDSVITVTVAGRSATHANVRARFNVAPAACVRAMPTLSASPQVQSGAAGTSLSYSMSVTNHDSPSCAPTTFALSWAVPAGWTGTVSTTALTLAPGATGQAALTVISASNAVAGAYAATMMVTDASMTAHFGSTAVTYTVPVPQDTESPSAPVTLTARVRSKRIELTWGASTDNDRVAGYKVWRNGTLVGNPTTTTWVDPAAKTGVTYTYLVYAYDPAGNMSPPSDAATITLSGGRR